MANVLPIIRRAWWLLHSSPQVHTVPSPSSSASSIPRGAVGIFQAKIARIRISRTRYRLTTQSSSWMRTSTCSLGAKSLLRGLSTNWLDDNWNWHVTNLRESGREKERETHWVFALFKLVAPLLPLLLLPCTSPAWVTIGHCTLRHKFRLFLKWPEPATLLCLAWVCMCVCVCIGLPNMRVYTRTYVCVWVWVAQAAL